MIGSASFLKRFTAGEQNSLKFSFENGLSGGKSRSNVIAKETGVRRRLGKRQGLEPLEVDKKEFFRIDKVFKQQRIPEEISPGSAAGWTPQATCRRRLLRFSGRRRTRPYRLPISAPTPRAS